MSFEKQLFHHFSQAEKALSKTVNNNYSDLRKQAYQNSLFSLLDAVRSRIQSTASLSPNDVQTYREVLNFIFKSLEFLDSSIFNLIPFEIVHCLEKALEEWMRPGTNHIVVTSLINNVDDFSFDPSLAQNEVFYDFMFSEYGIRFEHRLVQINIPKTLVRDYLISGVHYHELGHFVDSQYFITNSIAQSVFQDIRTGRFNSTQIQELIEFLPYLGVYLQNPAYAQSSFQYSASHIGEYFCDLFAAQYVGNSITDYLRYITSPPSFSPSHPDSDKRKAIVESFLSGQPHILIELINEALLTLTGKQLEIRFEEIDFSDLYRFLPLIVNNDRQLHGLFSIGTKVWNEDWSQFSSEMRMASAPEPVQLYNIINNLIEKSIGNYIIINKWNQIQQPLLPPLAP